MIGASTHTMSLWASLLYFELVFGLVALACVIAWLVARSLREIWRQ